MHNAGNAAHAAVGTPTRRTHRQDDFIPFTVYASYTSHSAKDDIQYIYSVNFSELYDEVPVLHACVYMCTHTHTRVYYYYF